MRGFHDIGMKHGGGNRLGGWGLSLAVFFALLVASAGAWGASAGEKNPFQELMVQQFQKRPAAPDFALRRVDGTSLRLSELKGKVVFLNFFATWCTPCRYEMPEMEALYKAFKDKGFEIVAVSIDKSSKPIGPFAKSLGLTFPIVHDPDMAAARQYGFRGPPLSYLIDRTGHVVGGAAGPRNWNSPAGQKIVKKLLTEPMS